MKLLDILLEQEKILITRRSKEERQKNHAIAIQKKIQQYIKNGSKGFLDLEYAPITSLPNGLEVGKDLHLGKTLLSGKYTEEEIRKMVPGVKGDIYMFG